MQHFALIHQQEREIMIGTVQDLKQKGFHAFDATFTTVDDLFGALQTFREQEQIITCVSDLDNWNNLWASKWQPEHDDVVTQ